MVIELTTEDQIRLTELAEATQRPETELAREAMHWFLAPRESHSEIIARSRLEIAEGRTIGHDELFAQIDHLLGK
jgi:predicted transcriptional regulator